MEDQLKQILALLVKFQNSFDRIEPKIEKIQQDVSVIDKRLNVIEQRLGNIEKWIPVENSNIPITA